MAKKIKLFTLIFFICAVACVVAYLITNHNVALSFAITFCTISYHFIMRLAVGYILNKTLRNNVDYTKKWFYVSEKEQKLYEKLKIKRWKNKMPTYDEDTFNPRKHSWEEIARATCQSELVHETIMIFSYLPIIATIWFGSLGVFIATSVLASIIDAIFVIMQRYNRPRIIKIIETMKKRAND